MPGHQGEDPAVTRAAAIAARGHGPPSVEVEAELRGALADDPDGRVRAAALGALARLGGAALPRAWSTATGDADAAVRARAADLAPAVAAAGDPGTIAATLLPLLDDREVTVVAATAWALGELADAAVHAGAVPALASVTTTHRDALAREAAVAALGALAHPDALPAILRACTDKPPVRRRAVLALAPYEGDEVEAALHRALEDKDWQTRQAAEDLLQG